jgi:hypothetical protein
MAYDHTAGAIKGGQEQSQGAWAATPCTVGLRPHARSLKPACAGHDVMDVYCTGRHEHMHNTCSVLCTYWHGMAVCVCGSSPLQMTEKRPGVVNVTSVVPTGPAVAHTATAPSAVALQLSAWASPQTAPC